MALPLERPRPRQPTSDWFERGRQRGNAGGGRCPRRGVSPAAAERAMCPSAPTADRRPVPERNLVRSPRVLRHCPMRRPRGHLPQQRRRRGVLVEPEMLAPPPLPPREQAARRPSLGRELQQSSSRDAAHRPYRERRTVNGFNDARSMARMSAAPVNYWLCERTGRIAYLVTRRRQVRTAGALDLRSEVSPSSDSRPSSSFQWVGR